MSISALWFLLPAVYVALIVYVLYLATRFVKAVERIADKIGSPGN
jgi:Ca2+/H+ antiporter